MIKKTQIIELFRNIEKTMVSFISIAMFILLATCMFLGIEWANTGFRNTIENDLNKGKMQDIEIVYPYGLTDDLIGDIRAYDDVETAEGFYNTEAFFKMDGLKYQANVVMLTETVNIPTHMIGKLPVLESEIAVEEHWAQTHGISVGDTIQLENAGTALKTLSSDTVKVTALVTSPKYINQYRGTFGASRTTGISCDCVFFAPEEAFNKEAFMGYTTVAVRSKSLRKYHSFSNEYKYENRRFLRRIKLLTDDYVDHRNANLSEGYKTYRCTLAERELSPAITATKDPMEIMVKVKYTLSLMFVIVGLFVCYSAVSRIVYEQAKLIGTKKALGLSRRQITGTYLLYSAIAVVIGSVLGVLMARFATEPVLLNILAENYNVTEIVFYTSITDMLGFFLFELAATLLFAYMASAGALKKRTVQLLKEENGIVGKRRWFEQLALWKKLSLLTRTIINNALNDKKRVFATITGIAGCCSLLVCALIMYVNVGYTHDYHFGKVATYDTMVFADTIIPEAIDEIDSFFREKGIKSARVYSSTAYIKVEEGYIGTELMVFEDNHFYNLFHIAADKEEHRINDGVWICKAYADYNDIKTGDRINILDSLGTSRSLKVGGIFDYYLPKDMFIMSAESYEEIFESDYIPNSVIIKRNGKDIRNIVSDLDKIEGVISVYNVKEEGNLVFDAVSNVIEAIVTTFIVLSIIMACIIILNLLMMFVSEKKRELIVMMINGYNKGSVKKYIYGDTIFLTIIGSLIGTVIGVLVGFTTLRLFSSDCVILLQKLSIPVCLICIAATGLLTAVSVMIAMRRIDGFKLRDINEM